MQLHSSSATVLMLALVFAACTSARTSAVAEGANHARPCSAAVEGSDLSEWQEVRGDGFSFCVPGDWRTSGRIAQRGDSRVEWNFGVPAPRGEGAPELGTGEVAGTPLMGMRRPNPTESLRFSETIDGRRVELFREALGEPKETLGGSFLTGAQWLGPTLHFHGQAGELPDAEIHFVIYRTLRFDAP